MVRQPPRRLTHTKAPEKGVDWSPDSRRLAFATKREGDELEQIYVLDLADGGEARRLTNVSTGASNPRWRPDGQAILFESSVYPHALDDEANKKIIAERKARKYNVRVYEHFPVRYWNQWLDDHQPTILVQEVAEGSSPHDVLSATALAQTPGFSGVEGETSVSLEPLWSRDGREIVFAATTERWNSASGPVGYHLYRVPASGGAEPQVDRACERGVSRGELSRPMASRCTSSTRLRMRRCTTSNASSASPGPPEARRSR